MEVVIGKIIKNFSPILFFNYSTDNFEFSLCDVALKLNPFKYSGEYNSD